MSIQSCDDVECSNVSCTGSAADEAGETKMLPYCLGKSIHPSIIAPIHQSIQNTGIHTYKHTERYRQDTEIQTHKERYRDTGYRILIRLLLVMTNYYTQRYRHTKRDTEIQDTGY